MVAAADDLGDDMMEQILIRSDAEVLKRCKGVCKSWYSIISTPCFVESFVKRSYNNNGPQRITGKGLDYSFLATNRLFVVGSANGLVCVSPTGFQLLVVNPCTRQAIKILEPPPEPLCESKRRWKLTWGFGYDSSNNDYKIVVGLVRARNKRDFTRFYVLSLKTCLWKFIGEYEYAYRRCSTIVSGIFCDGALHWHLENHHTSELAILSFNLSHDKFTKTRPPDGHSQFEDGTYYTLGVMEESLCFYVESPFAKITWVFGSDNTSCGKKSWVLLPVDNYVINYAAVYLMNDDDYSINHDTLHVLSNTREYISAPIYVRSPVSPHFNTDFSAKSVVNSSWHGKEEKCYNKLIKGSSRRRRRNKKKKHGLGV